MNKKQIRAERLNRHYAALERLAADCGCKKINGKRISCAWFTWQCNGYTCSGIASWQLQEQCRFQPSEAEIDAKHDAIRAAVAKVLGAVPPAFCINSDPRGYALKLEAAGAGTVAAKEYGLERDMGGYQLLAPEIE